MINLLYGGRDEETFSVSIMSDAVRFFDRL